MESFIVQFQNYFYLLGAILFIYGIKGLGSAKTARRGNFIGFIGMMIVIIYTILMMYVKPGFRVEWLIIGVIIGSAIGAASAIFVKMTQMPQMVALFNGFGGAASVVVAYAEYLNKYAAHSTDPSAFQRTVAATPVDFGDINIAAPAIVLSVLIGAITFTGSFIAFAKLQEIMTGKPILFPMQKPFNALVLLAILVFGANAAGNYMFGTAFLGIDANTSMYIVLGLSLLMGILLTIPIGGADMPVVISLLNSYSGLAAAATGFVIGNFALIITGSLVGASGIILTQIMCKAMNRSLANVLFAGVGATVATGSGEKKEKRSVISYTPDDVVISLESASNVIIIPGYGLAVSQAQHALQELVNLLGGKGVNVRYAIHPVAGRMPGHMNVLLAEANAPYDTLFPMEEINDDFGATDVALVIGANDVINPAARTEKSCPIYGMPILNADQASRVIIFKRSLAVGFAGLDNELFYNEKTMMVFGDAKKSLTELIQILKAS